MGSKAQTVVEHAEAFTHPADEAGVAGPRSSRDLRPPEELSRSSYVPQSPAPSNLDTSTSVPGDTFGTYETRTPFLRPVMRNTAADNVEFAALMPPDAKPEHCVAPDMLRRLCGKFGFTPREALHLMIDSGHDINVFLNAAHTRFGKRVMPGDYGVVALESYDPETFCLVNFCLPTFEATRDPDYLEACYELALSAAEIPVDTPRERVVDRFTRDWTTENDERCGEVLARMDASVRDVVLLPFGEYSTQGFFVANVSSKEFPNIGTGAAAACYDLRSGIHARFRFHAERNADSVAEHVLREQMHFDQWYVHMLRQCFWFNPEYSVEDFLRYKESLLMPSATIYELRVAAMAHNLGGRPAYRNIAEIEKVKIAQNKLDKGGKEQAMSGALFDNQGASKVMSAMKMPNLSMYNNVSKDKSNYKEITLENKMFENAEVCTHGERIWSKFYRNNFF